MAQPDRIRTKYFSSLPDLSEKMKREPAIFVIRDVPRHQMIMRQPSLIEDDNKSSIRYNVFNGRLYTSSWHHVKLPQAVTVEELEEQNLIVLGKRGRRQVYENEVDLVWKEFPDIETAIRATEHVLQAHAKEGGTMVENTKYIIGTVSRLLPLFKNGPMTLQNLEDIAQAAAGQLREAGFFSASKPVKQAVYEQVTNGLGVDSLGRVNRLVTRSRLVSAWIKLIRELLFAEGVREKYQDLHDILLSEREVERFALDQSIAIMNDLINNFPTDYKGLEKGITTLKNLSLTLLTPDLIKVAPYRRAALLSRFVFFGDSLVRGGENKIRYREMVRQLFQNEGMFQQASRMPPLDIEMPNVSINLAMRLGAGIAAISDALSTGERNLPLTE